MRNRSFFIIGLLGIQEERGDTFPGFVCTKISLYLAKNYKKW